MSTTSARPTGGPPGPDAEVYTRVQQEPEFQELRRRLRVFVFPVTGLFLGWYFLYVLLAAYAPDLMATPVVGNVNLGIVLGLGQFASTLAITLVYIRYANRRLDPLAAGIREEIEGAAQ